MGAMGSIMKSFRNSPSEKFGNSKILRKASTSLDDVPTQGDDSLGKRRQKSNRYNIAGLRESMPAGTVSGRCTPAYDT